MKKIFTVVIFCLATSFIFAHDINYEKVILRNWSIEKENRFIEGSFYMYKNDMVYIEDINSNIISIPLSKLSDTDKAFVLQKSNKIAQFSICSIYFQFHRKKETKIFDTHFGGWS